ncbi:hypothetical protein SSP531S_13180 [Streptomyces spongiicola]|uniref:Acetyl-coenzyme A carboxylase carboxyl transferase subunit beta domain-containing protein n=1 Tax=Streptomyces spongiicola TaxID=1690221 RepID=A0A388SY52_9ACTN|nr:hypothetical protein SSP531S_13180 [Streptomyces spongiicola]
MSVAEETPLEFRNTPVPADGAKTAPAPAPVRREIAAAADPDAIRARLVEEYRAELMHPYYAAERGLVDSVIDPAETRVRLIGVLEMLSAEHVPLPSRKHGNQPQ